MLVRDIDFKKLQKENADTEYVIHLIFNRGICTDSKKFTSFTALYNYLTSHEKAKIYMNSGSYLGCEEKTRTWDDSAIGVIGVIKVYTLTIYDKMETPKVPYYQFCNGTACNVNGTTYAPEIKDVIFNPPATIVKWADGTKTVVKAHGGDVYDPEMGLAMAISKKMYGNKYSYYNVFKKWLKKFDDNVAKKALARVAKSVIDAWDTEPVSNGFRELEETDIKLKQLTGYDSKELLDLFAEGFTLVKETKLIPDADKATIYCKNCKNFTPNPSNDPWEDDGTCDINGKGTYGMNSCDKAVSKAIEF